MTVYEMENEQRMLDPVCPFDFLFEDLRYDWLRASVRFWKCGVGC